MSAVVFSVPAFSLRRIETPFERKPGIKNYVAVVDARHLPDLTKWREINVRDAKVKGRVPRAIRKSFEERPEEFVFLNRGLVIAADKVELVNGDQPALRLSLRDPEVHGLLDGGHTYRIVREEARKLGADEPSRFVKLEFITGFDREGIGELVEARNTSNQVRDESLQNLNKEFDPIKESLNGQPYFNDISWSEYQELDGVPKPIDIRDIISYLIAFDYGSYNSTNHPLIAYKDKRACLRHFEENRGTIKKLYALLPDILTLWDEIHENWRAWYLKGRADEDGKHGKFLKLTAVQKAEGEDEHEELFFKRITAPYSMPDAYKYPILAAMRAALKTKKNGPAEWATPPVELLKSVGPQLAAIVGTSIRNTNSPNKVGKDAATWSSCYLVVDSALEANIRVKHEQKILQLERELKELRKTKTVKR